MAAVGFTACSASQSHGCEGGLVDLLGTRQLRVLPSGEPVRLLGYQAQILLYSFGMTSEMSFSHKGSRSS